MSLDIFDFLMVLAVGSLTGTGIGLIIGFVAKKQGSVTLLPTRKERILNCALIAGCSCVSVIGLGWLFLK